ncbi:hypothetical protein ACKXGF_07510 [Alkalibacillus sp. S2W]|uniref:hypothetical protein n=1 Tax=Alkalibacillus sp. S2W TaxID=3386553 RepID=UPI00398D3E32
MDFLDNLARFLINNGFNDTYLKTVPFKQDYQIQIFEDDGYDEGKKFVQPVEFIILAKDKSKAKEIGKDLRKLLGRKYYYYLPNNTEQNFYIVLSYDEGQSVGQQEEQDNRVIYRYRVLFKMNQD